MNHQSEIFKRLLRSFPVKTLKQHFSATESSQNEIISEIIQSQHIQAISNYVYTHFNYSKQHIYFYNLSSNHSFKAIDFSDLQGFTLIDQDVTANRHLVFGLFSVYFDAVIQVNGQYSVQNLEFFQPLMIEIKSNYLIIKFTVLETKLSHYFPANTVVLNSTKKVDEKLIISHLLDKFSNLNPSKADLNKGIKYLWDNDVIDSKEVSFRKSASMSKEVMDEDKLVKVEYKEVYDELIKSPLNKSIFRYLIDDEQFCKHFTCDASNGEITIPIYSKDSSQIENVLNEIIRNN